MKKPVFNQDILSFCKEMGVKSPEELIGKRIYLKYFFQEEENEEEKGIENIVISKISEIAFRVCFITEADGEPKGFKVAIMSTLGCGDNLFIIYYLDEKKAEIIEYSDLYDSYFCYLSIEEMYVYPNSVE